MPITSVAQNRSRPTPIGGVSCPTGYDIVQDESLCRGKRVADGADRTWGWRSKIVSASPAGTPSTHMASPFSAASLHVAARGCYTDKEAYVADQKNAINAMGFSYQYDVCVKSQGVFVPPLSKCLS